MKDQAGSRASLIRPFSLWKTRLPVSFEADQELVEALPAMEKAPTAASVSVLG